MDDNRSELEELSERDCVRLLREHDLGRIAVVVDQRPQIFPVNYAVDDSGRYVVIRSFGGVKMAKAPLTYVAFEVDEVDRTAGIAWSVLVQGSQKTSPLPSTESRPPFASSRSSRSRQATLSAGWRSHWTGSRAAVSG